MEVIMHREKIALYLRLSREDQDKSEKDESNSIQNQRSQAISFIKQDVSLACYDMEEYIDDGYSGATMDRPAIQRLLEEVKCGNINCIIVKDFSRFARNYIEMGKYLEQIFPYIGIRFISINDRYDSNNNYGNIPSLDVAFKGILHDYYCKELSLKARKSRKQLNEKGMYIAALPPYGYWKSKTDNKKLVIDKISSTTVKRIFKLALNNESLNFITNILNAENVPSPKKRLVIAGLMTNKEGENFLWTVNAVKRILTNPVYTGKVVGQKYRKTLGKRSCKRNSECEWIIVDHMHELIITQSDFDKVSKRFSKSAQKKYEDFLFKGRLKCSKCGKVLVRTGEHKGNSYFACYSCSYENPKQENIHINSKILIDTIGNELENMIKEFGIEEKQPIKHSVKKTLKSEQEILIEIDKLKNMLSILYEKYADGNIGREDYIKEKKLIGSDIMLLETKINENVAADNLCKEILENGNENPYELTNGLVDMFINRITIYENNKFEVDYQTF